jgi:hypothetical protein
MKYSADDILSDLNSLGLDGIVIRHQPMTARYLTQASASLRRLLTKGVVLGWREITPYKERSIEAILFCSPILGPGSCGLYGGFRLHYQSGDLVQATFFCFYNGEDKSPCFADDSEALTWMNNWAAKNKTAYNVE